MSRRTVTPLIAGLSMLLLLPGTASAKTRLFQGTAKGDEHTSILLTAKGKKKKGKFKANKVLEVSVSNQYYECVKANGDFAGLEGRFSDPGFARIEPMKVNEKGKFSGSFEDKVTSPLSGTRTVGSYKFEGKIKHKGKYAEGTYQGKRSEAGIEFGYCGDPVPRPWKAEWARLSTDP
jgi:hypothetical protein